MATTVNILHPSLCQVGGAEILMVKQAALLGSLGASVRIRTLDYDAANWASRVGPVPVDTLRALAPGRMPPKVPRYPSDRRLSWLLDDLGGTDLAIAHNYPASSALGSHGNARLRLWYCHEPPRSLYPVEVSPYLRENAARAPSRHGPRYYRTSLNSWFGGLPFVGRRATRVKEADRRGVLGLDGIWANSEYTRDNVRRVYGSVDVDVVYPMVDVPAAVGARSGLPTDGLEILTLTRLEWVKNLDTLLEGFATFRRKNDPRSRLHVVGVGPVAGPLREQAARLGVGESVELHGFLSEEEVARLAARCHVFACLPLDEPFGMVFPEAMAHGLLVLGPDHGGPLETLDAGRLGEIVDALNPEAIAEGLARLRGLSNAEADQRRAAGALAVRQRFSPAASAARVTGLLERHGVRF